MNTGWKDRAEELNAIWNSTGKTPEYRAAMVDLILKEIKEDDTLTILDCGMGTGILYDLLPSEVKKNYYGVDFTEDMVKFVLNKYPNSYFRFNQMDLTDTQRMSGVKSDIVVTQNVIQHILLFQQALDNIFDSASHCVLLCERTHKAQTLIYKYEPAVRWRFNINDMYRILTYFADKHGYKGKVEILGHPKTTFDEPNMLTIFRVYRNKSKLATLKLSDFEYEPIHTNIKQRDSWYKKKRALLEAYFSR